MEPLFLLFNAFFFTLLLFCAFVAFAQWRLRKDGAILWYVGYLLATFLHYGRQFWLDEVARQGFPPLPDLPLEWDTPMSYVAFACYFSFIRQIMRIWLVAPRLSNVLFVVARGFGGMIFLNLWLQIMWGYSISEAVHQVVQLLLFPLMLWIVVHLLRNARLFYEKLILSGTVALVVGFVCVIASRRLTGQHDWVPEVICCFPTAWGDVCFYHLKVGVALDVLFFSWALTLRQQQLIRQEQVARTETMVPPVIVLPPHKLPTDTFLVQLHDFLDKKLGEEQLTVDLVAAEMHLSKSQTARTIKHKTGFTTEQYIVRYRLDKGKELILSTQMPIGEVAILVGFKEVAHFSNAFKRAFGVSPSEVRRAQNQAK